MTTTLNKDQTVAIDIGYHWQPMSSCPHNVKVQLLNAGGVAVYGVYHGGDSFWQMWAPLPSMPKKI